MVSQDVRDVDRERMAETLDVLDNQDHTTYYALIVRRRTVGLT
jgi:hypothetical protein